ncbi:putative integral membrane protein [Eutypa lata UCREL1]|uniref:Putative integral membrane protein n=1 Tax=Eutypa lata (strain UCR-EL1) TaxID=1287681 RepID=M7SBU4_EUTLA|nr:putative integral membrane protein [Eutypa lata UCREL1]
MIIMGLVSTGSMVFILTDCKPFAANWNKRLDLQMQRRVKISVICVLGLGVFASFAAMMRIVFYQYVDTRNYPDDELFNHARLIIWSELEGGFAIIAASLPALRKLFGRFFRGSSAGSKVKTATNNGLERSGLRGTQLASLTPQGKSRTMVSGGGGKWDRLSDENDTSSRIHIMKQTEVHINESTPSELEADMHGTDWRDADSEKISR